VSDSSERGDSPVRFRIAYQRPERLLGEFTRSVNRPSVTLVALRAIEVGTRFVFELTTEGIRRPVEVDGEVTAVRKTEDGRFRVEVAYSLAQRGGLDEVVYQILASQRGEHVRGAPRVPLNMRATEESPYSPAYLIRDLALGGAGIEVEAPQLPKAASVGAPILLRLLMRDGSALELRGVVVWTVSAAESARLINSSFGVLFVDELELEALETLDRIISVKTIPVAARLSFGVEAFAPPTKE
jgi:hypothetical protein